MRRVPKVGGTRYVEQGQRQLVAFLIEQRAYRLGHIYLHFFVEAKWKKNRKSYLATCMYTQIVVRLGFPTL